MLLAALALTAAALPALAKDEPKPLPAECPKTKMQESCLRCHVVPSFKIKEQNPHRLYEYPNTNTKIIEADGKKVAYFLLEGAVEHGATGNRVQEFLEYARQRGFKHVVIEVQSQGGSLFEGWRIHGLLEAAKKKGMVIETRCYGMAMSAAFIIFASGSQGHRIVSPEAELMWHELISFKLFAVDSPSSSMDEAIVLRHLQDTANSWLASVSHMTKDEIDRKVHKKELWLRGTEAIEAGFADRMLGQ